jgi:hypothetical protein
MWDEKTASFEWSRGGWLWIVKGPRAGRSEFHFRQRQSVSLPPACAYRTFGPARPCVMNIGVISLPVRQPFSHLHLERGLRMCGAIPPFIHTSSCRGDWLSTGATNFNSRGDWLKVKSCGQQQQQQVKQMNTALLSERATIGLVLLL